MIKHILADGTELKNIDGRIIPPTGKTESVYGLLAEHLINSKSRKTSEKPQAEQT